MFRKQVLTISRPQHEVEHVLRAHGNILPPKDAPLDCRFTLYKTVRKLWIIRLRGIPISFRFAGSYRQAGANTEVTYTVSPGLSTYFLGLLLVFLPIGALLRLNSADGNLSSLFGILLLDLIFGGSIILAKSVVNKNFENLLTGKSDVDF